MYYCIGHLRELFLLAITRQIKLRCALCAAQSKEVEVAVEVAVAADRRN